MSSRKSAWGLGGAVVMAFLAGCSGSLNEVGKPMGGGSSNEGGDPNEAGRGGTAKGGSGEVAGTGGSGEVAGSGGTGESGGFGGTGYEFGGTGGAYPIAGSGGYYEFGGTGGYYPVGGAGGYAGNGSVDCFAPFTTYSGSDQLDLGPENSVLLDVHLAQEPIKNSANQLVFPNSPYGQWETYANFPAVDPATASKTDITLPAELASIPANLAQFYVTRRSCDGRTVGGHKLLLEVWWEGGPHQLPTHGFALGAYDEKKKATTWFQDATKAFVVGDDENKSLFDKLNRIQLVHTFASGDKTDAGQLVVGLWLAGSYEYATSFYVGNVKWD